MKARFGEFSLDGTERVLQRAGKPIALEPKVFDCIELLVRQAGRLTTTEHLRAALWPDTTVGPGALRRIINEARKALGDRGDAQAFIRTRKGLGYVFTPAVQRDGAPGLAPEALIEPAAPAAWPFVGRAHELGLLRKRFASGGSRERFAGGGLCFISGEAGAGKSSLLAALASEPCAREGALFLRGHCQAAERLPAFWPFRELAEQMMKDPVLRRRILPLQARERRALRVIPEFGGAHSASRHSAAASAEERFEVCAAYAKLLCRLADDTPLAIAIEDLHWADDGTLLLLETVARAAHGHALGVFASYRPEAVVEGKPLSALIARTSGRDGTTTVHVRALTPEDLQALLAQVRHPAGSGTAQALFGLTGGNALFVRELVTHALSTERALDGQLPASLPHIVAERVSSLPEATRQLIGQAAVLGDEVPLGLLGALANATRDALLRDLEPALRSGILRRGEDPEQLHFTHRVLADALCASLPVERKQAHHRDALIAYKRMQPSPVRDGALAAHAFMAGSSVPDAERRELCRRAGRDAFAALAFDRAALHLGRAVRLLEDGDTSLAAAELVLLWARARWHADDPADEVERAFLHAAERARRANAPAVLAEAAIGYAVGAESSLYFRSAWRRPDAMALAEEAFAALTREAADATPNAQALELRHRLAATLCWMRAEAGELAEFQSAAKRALQFAPPTSGASAFRQLSVLALRAAAADAQAAAAIEQDMLAQLRKPGLSARQRIESYLLVMSGCLSRGDTDGYEQATAEIARLGDVVAQPPRFGRLGDRISAYVAIPLFARVTLATIRGEFAQAEQAFAAMAEQAQRLGFSRNREGDNNVFYMLLQLLGYQGKCASLEPLLDAHLRTTPNDVWSASVAKAQFALERGDLVAARAHYVRLRETEFRPSIDGQLLPVKPDTLVRIADVCGAIGDRDGAALLYERLRPRAQFCIHDGPLVCLGSCSRALGELSLSLGEHARAELHFADALAMNTRAGHRPELVRTRLGLARLLQATRREPQARPLIDAALADARAIGMQPLVTHAERLSA